MTPFRLQEPPRPCSALPRIMAGPPRSLTFFSFPLAKNPTSLLSGDQNGSKPPSVPATAHGYGESRSRTQSLVLPSLEAANTTRSPLGEIAGTLLATKVAPSGE